MSGLAIAALGIAVLALLALIGYLGARARQAERRFQVLYEIALVADGGRSLEETLEAIAGILVPELGDFCMIDVIEEGGIRRAAVRFDGPEAAVIEKGLAERKPALQERIASAAAVARQEPKFFERVTEADLRGSAENEEDLRFLLAMRVRSFVTVELRARGRPTGLLSLGVSHSGRRFRQDDAHFAGILAGRVALALDNAGLFSDLERSERERSQIAETLQRGLLPPPLPHIPGWSVAAMYRPAGAENEIGGDFYDAFRIAGGWMVVIGDVTGRGAQAASITALARYTLRTAAALTGDPVIALETLNRALLARRGASLCSVAAMAIGEDPLQPVRLAIAGHPSPLLVDGDSVTEVATPAPVLGAFSEISWPIEHTSSSPGSSWSSSLTASPRLPARKERFGEDRLHAELAGVGDPALATQKLEAALNHLHRGQPRRRRGNPRRRPDRGGRARFGLRRGPPPDRAPLRGLQPPRRGGHPRPLRRRASGFFPVGTAEAIGRTAPYIGPAGLHEYLGDVEKAWEELLVTPTLIERRGDSLLVRGRAYVRSRELGIRDLPMSWIWHVEDDRFVRGEVFPDPEQAVLRLAASA